jgi:hypothetical protein
MPVTRRIAASLALVASLGTLPALAAEPTKQQCVAANDAAQDYRQQGKLHAAREKLALCVSQSCPGPVREDCAQRLEELDRVTPTVVLEAIDAAGNDLSAVRVTLDGQPLADKIDGAAIAVDPGEHHLVFETEGQPSVEKTVVLREGEKGRRIRAVLGGTAEPRSTREAAKPEAPEAPSDGSGQRTVGLVLAGAGVVGVVIGSVFGLAAKSTYDQASQACRDGTGPCLGADVGHSNDAHSQAAVSTGAFVVGGALIAGGLVLYLTAPKANVAIAPNAGTSAVGLRLVTTW